MGEIDHRIGIDIFGDDPHADGLRPQAGRRDHHGAPLDELVIEMREKARAAGVLTPHILPDGSHLTQPHEVLPQGPVTEHLDPHPMDGAKVINHPKEKVA